MPKVMNATGTANTEIKRSSPAVQAPDQAETRTGSHTARTLRADTATADPLRPAKINPKRAAFGFTTAVFVIIAGYGGYRWWNHSQTWVKTDNAYVAAHVHTVSARVEGTVQEVMAEENQTVPAGFVLARLDPRDLEIRKHQAQAQVSVAEAQAQQARAKFSEAQAQVAREQARAGKARLDLARARSLFEGGQGAISKQEFDQASAEADAAEAGLKAAGAAVLSAQALAKAGEAQEQAAQANLEDAQQKLAYTEIKAPVSGRVGRKNLESGNRVQPGQALLALVEPEVWITGNFKETQLGRMKPGQHVRIRFDAFPGRLFVGTVESLSPATGSQFALLPPDNATGNFTKIVQRVPVKIVFQAKDLGDCAGRIVPGMSAVVEVNVRG